MCSDTCSDRVYTYRFKNNPKRLTLYRRRCRVLARLTMNSVAIEFLDNGQREVVSRNALRRDSVNE